MLEPGAVEYFEAAVGNHGSTSGDGAGANDPTDITTKDIPVSVIHVFNWMTSELFGVLRACGQTIRTTTVSPTTLRAVVALVGASHHSR